MAQKVNSAKPFLVRPRDSLPSNDIVVTEDPFGSLLARLRRFGP